MRVLYSMQLVVGCFLSPGAIYLATWFKVSILPNLWLFEVGTHSGCIIYWKNIVTMILANAVCISERCAVSFIWNCVLWTWISQMWPCVSPSKRWRVSGALLTWTNILSILNIAISILEYSTSKLHLIFFPILCKIAVSVEPWSINSNTHFSFQKGQVSHWDKWKYN